MLAEERAVWLVLMLAAFLVLLIPLLGISLLKITNDQELMGDYRNGWVTNFVLITLILIAMYFAYENGTNLWESAVGR